MSGYNPDDGCVQCIVGRMIGSLKLNCADEILPSVTLCTTKLASAACAFNVAALRREGFLRDFLE